MKNRNFGIAILAFLFSISSSFAQKVTIQGSTEMAFKNNKSIKVQMIEVERSHI